MNVLTKLLHIQNQNEFSLVIFIKRVKLPSDKRTVNIESAGLMANTVI